jgi:hypothetical protein
MFVAFEVGRCRNINKNAQAEEQSRPSEAITLVTRHGLLTSKRAGTWLNHQWTESKAVQAWNKVFPIRFPLCRGNQRKPGPPGTPATRPKPVRKWDCTKHVQRTPDLEEETRARFKFHAKCEEWNESAWAKYGTVQLDFGGSSEYVEQGDHVCVKTWGVVGYLAEEERCWSVFWA